MAANTLWIAVGNGTNSIARSTDGLTWSGLGKTTFTDIGYGIAYGKDTSGNNVLVGVGQGGNTVAYSTNNGNTWTGLTTTVFSTQGLKILYDPNAFLWIAVGNGTNNIATSTSPTTSWSGQGLVFPSAKCVYGPATGYSGTQNLSGYVLGGYSSGSLSAYSLNGTTWQMASGTSTSLASQGFGTIVYGNGIYVAGGIPVGSGNSFATSTDQISWTGRGGSTLMTNVSQIAYGNGIFIAVGTKGASGSTVMKSTDGITWTNLTDVYTTAGGRCVAYYDGRWFIAGVGTGINYSDNNGTTWTSSTSSYSNQTRSFGYGYSVVASVGQGTSNSLAISTDFGVSWTGKGLLLAGYGNDIKYNGGVWLAVGGDNTSTGNIIVKSTDNGTTWTQIVTYNSSYFTSLTGVQNVNGLWYISGRGAYYLAYSNTNNPTSISDFTMVSTSSVSFSTNGAYLTTFNYQKPKYIVGGQGMKGSMNGLSWFDIFNQPFITVVNDVYWNGTIWVGVGSGNNTLGYSYDGINWIGIGATVFTTSGNNVYYSVVNSLWIATGQGGNTIATSADGITWTGRGATVFTHAGYKVGYDNNLLVAVGVGGNTIASSTDGTSWTSRSPYSNLTKGYGIAYGNGLYVAVGSSSGSTSGIATSADGITWINRGMGGFRTYIYDVAYGKDGSNNDLWVAVGYLNSIAYSYNGITWTSGTGAIFTNIAYGVAYGKDGSGNGLWVATGNGGNTIVTSSNGINWTGRGNFFTNTGTKVAYGNGVWVVVGTGPAGGSHIVTSTNGVTWTNVSYANSANLYTSADSVAYGKDGSGNGLWVAIGNGTIISSVSGTSWTSRYNVGSGNYIYAIAYGDGLWVANTGSGGQIVLSSNGTTWTSYTITGNILHITGLTYNNGLWVATGSGTNTIATSTNAINWTGRGGIVLTIGYDIVSPTAIVAKTKTVLTNFVVAAKTVGDAAFELVAPTSNSDGEFTYTSSNIAVATVTNNMVTIVGGGTATITATQASTAIYASGTITATLTVSKITTVLSNFSVPGKTMGDTAFTITPPTTNSDSAFTYTSSNTAVVTIAGSTVTIVGGGSSTITAVQFATPNYLTATITASLIVTQVPTITNFSVPVKVLENAPFTIVNPTSNSSGAFTYTSSDTSVVTIDGSMVSIVGLGTSTITASQASTTFYLAGSITATFIVRLTPVITNFSAITKTFGDASFSIVAPTTDSDGAFTYTSSNTAVATVSGTTITIVSAGTSTITATQSLTANYVSGTITATLTVNKATTVLSNFFEITKTFGDAAFTISRPTSSNDSSSLLISYQMEGNLTNLGGDPSLNGTLVGTASYNSSVFKRGTQSLLSNLSSYISIPTVSLNKASGLTIAFWFYRTGVGTEIFAFFNNGTSTQSSFQINSFGNGTNYNMYFGFANWSTNLFHNYLSINVWNHFAVTLTYSANNTSTHKVYADGVLRSTISNLPYPSFPSSNNRVGQIQGYTDDFRIYQKVLTDADITNVYNNTALSTDALLTYSSSNTAVATIAGSTVTIVGVGTAAITASQATTTNYLAETISASMTVSQATPTITNFSVPAKVLENAPFTIVNPTSNSSGAFTYTSSDTSVATIEGNVVSIVGKGTSTITVSQASTTNYVSGSITATFIVRLTHVITNFSAITKTFGDASFSIVAPTTDSDGAFTYTSSNTAVATVSGTTITIVSAGTSTITASQSLTANYVSGTITTTLTVNKATPTITNFSAITKTFGNAAFSLVAPTSNSTGAFTYTSSNTAVATIAGSTVTIVGGGTATITASQATTTNYLAETISAIMTVNQAMPTITNFSVPAKVLENAPFTIVNPTSNSSGAFTYTSSDTSVATIDGSMVTIVGKGTSTITATQASTTNYLARSITATFIVRLTPVITNFSAITKTFGVLAFFIVAPTTDSDGTLTYTSSNTAVATVSGTTITIIGGGTSTITATQALTANYVSGTITATLTVNKATPTITNFSAITKTFGNAAFSLVAPTSNSTGAFTYTSSDTAVATIAGSTVTIVGGGTATITASQATTTNYLAGTITATLTINKATTVLSNFSAITKTFGNAAFSITQPTTNSNGAFTYTSSNTAVATIAGSTVTIVGGGTATITASQATTTNYLAGTITATMNVSQATPTITIFDVPAKAIGTAPFTLVNPTSNSSGAFTYTSSNTSVATIDGSMVAIVGLGNTTITAVQASTTNYLSGSITGILAIMVNVPLSIAVGSGGNSIATSIDRGLTWTGRTGTTVFSTSGSCVAFGKDGSGNNLLVAVGQGGNTIATSTNGTTWIGRGASVFTTQGIGITYANNLWVAVGKGTNSIATSPDGIVWTGRTGTSIFSNQGIGVAFNNGLWVAVGQGTNSIATSPDGVVWTGRTGTSIFSNQGICVAFNNGLWIAVGDGTSNSIATSTDGTVWTGRGKTALSGWGRSVAYGNGLWVAVGQGTNSIATSPDGVVWTGRTGTSIFSNQGIGVAFNSGVWIAVGQGTNTVATSTDGVNWIGRGTSIFSTSGFGVAVGIITPPNITGISPSSGAIVGGTSVTITGTNFTGATSVTFDGLAATTINVVNSTTITCITPARSAGAVGIIVTTEDGPSGEFSSFTYIAPPNITGISPLSGSTAGGTNATITGTSFIGVTSVTFGGIEATSISVVNSTTITCITPARSVGAIGIIVTTLYGTSGTFSPFTYITPPNITSISQLTGSTAGGTNITITGTNFTGATTVTFDSLAATSLSVVNSTTITCITPARSAGAVGIIVTTGGGPSGAFSSYTYITPASITDISPSSGSTLGGTNVTITGTNFTGATSVTFGGLAATSLSVVNSTTITCITRDRSAGAGAVGIIVTTGGGPSGAFSSFNYITPPNITGILPSSGSTAGGTSVTITGTSFTGATLVTFGGLSATSLNVVNSTTITCITPVRSTGAVGIIVTSLYGKSGAFSSFTYITPPIISRISPSSGGIAGGTSVTITGKNFTGATLVTFGGIAATSISIVNSTTITCLTPTVDSAGAAGIIVTTGGGPSGPFSSFTYIPPPVISSISQLTGSTEGGTNVTITGTNFTGATLVTFDGLAATSLSIVNSTTITCITPAHNAGTAGIIVTTEGGPSCEFSSFAYITPSVITSISPSYGSTAGGTSVTITGTNFTGATSVTFGGIAATSLSVVNSTTITCITPARTTAGDVGIIVTTGGGPSGAFSPYTYITPPNITGISPLSGSIAGGTNVTITGTNFTGATSVTFDGIAATSLSVVNSNTITCITPAHNAGAVDIIVTTEGGPSGAFSSYIYITPSVITSISPSYGSTAGGTSVTITGTNFTGATSVTFDGTAATSLSIVNSTTITCITPAHATAGAVDVIVRTGGGPSGAFSPYTYITPASITDISPSSGINTGGTSVTITGTNFTGATSVTFGGLSATSLSIVNSTTITCITPAVDSDGAVGIIVTTEGGPSGAFSSFTYITNPNITGILPSSGSIAGGTNATITGINFTGATSVTFDGLAATNISVVNSTTITCITPAHNAGAVDIIVTAEGGPSDAFSSFTYITPPNITGILSSSGSTLGGTNATITGTNFTGATSVTFDGLAATSLTIVDNTTITCITPAHNAGDVGIIVTTEGGPSGEFSSFTYITPPNITGILPSSGSILGGTSVTITGTSFTEATSVTFVGLAATSLSIVNSTTITCITPAHNAGDVDIIVTTIYGTSDAFSQFTYITPPNITSISQLTGSTAGGTNATITGTNFTGATSVTFDGLAATTINVVNNTTITCITPAHIAGAVGIIVTTDGGPSGEFSSFTYITPPNITSISKLTGSTAGETNVTITGTNFTGATSVTFGGIAATSLSVVNSTTITCITPAHDAGAVGIIVTTGGGPSSAFSSFTYITPPNITGILPSSGSTAGGTSVTITGTNFTGATSVTFDGLAATTINVVNNTTITCITPARSAGSVGIIVTTGGGPSSEFSSFTYNTPPNITGISSLTGSTTGGTSITITGTSFTGATSVTFGGVAATSLTLVDSTTITCITPARATAGAVGVIVTTGGGPSGAFSSFTYILPPNIKSMTPSSVSRVGGTIVTITGTNFIGATSVTLGGLNATSFNVVNGTSITCITPARTTGGMVSVIVTTGGGPSNAFSTFIYAPFVSAILPAFGTRTGGTGVKITGIAFTGATSVTFGGIPATNVFVFNPTTITCKTPAGIAAGDVGVIVTTGHGPSGAFSSFNYLTPPNITSISPSYGGTVGETIVIITGKCFTGVSSVLFGGIKVKSLRVIDDTTITCVTAARTTPGPVGITVQNSIGISNVFSSYTYIITPKLTSISPNFGSTTGGNTVTITGTDFTGATEVKVGDLSCSSFTVVDSTTLTCITPARIAPGPVGIIVTTGGGPTKKSSPFTYILPPVITSISPPFGGTTGGNVITITGVNFKGATSVTFGGLNATLVKAVNDTTITCKTPVSITAGPVDVIVRTGGGPSGAFSSFTYITPPVISAISPPAGNKAGGNSITITGTNLTGATSVLFGKAVSTNITVVDDTTITCITPLNPAGAFGVIVRTGGGPSGAFASFTFVTPAAITGVLPLSGSTNGGTFATIKGKDFTGATSVTIGGVEATSFTVVNDTTITCITPARIGAGGVGIIVTTAGGPSKQFSFFNYITPPVITSLSPSTGSIAGGTIVTITGTNFTGATSVTIGGKAATPIKVVDNTTITCKAPVSTSAGPVDVIVTTGGGPSIAFSSFTYVTPAVITSISPAFGPKAGGTSVTITGTNFTGASNLLFGLKSATNVNVVNDTTITCVTPDSTNPIAVGITLTTGGGLSNKFSSFTYR